MSVFFFMASFQVRQRPAGGAAAATLISLHLHFFGVFLTLVRCNCTVGQSAALLSSQRPCFYGGGGVGCGGGG